jgi:DNA-binding FadR family transcriptional regulator
MVRTAEANRRRYEVVAERIEAQILSGQLQQGARMPSERELMERFAVGRSTVREALLSLRKRGLLETAGGARGRVTFPDPRAIVSELTPAVRHMLVRPEGIRNLQHARAVFETALAREAALRASPEAIQDIGIALSENEASIDDPEAFRRTDLGFHLSIAKAAQNPLFTALHDAMLGWLAEQRSVTRQAGARADVVYAEHRRVYDAIAARDAVGAMAAMEDHLANVVRNYWKAMAPAFALSHDE